MNFITIVLLIASSFPTNAKILIEREFSLCKANELMLDATNNCVDLSPYDKLECESFTNDLHVLMGFEDQFNYVNSPRGLLIVYSSSNKLYLTNCTNVSGITVPEKVNSCTRDLPVLLREKNQTKIIYLTKQDILRHDSIEMQCNTDYEFFEFNNITIVRQNKFITALKEVKKKVSFYSKQIDFQNFSSIQKFNKGFINFYRTYLAKNENFQMIRDFMEIIIIFCFIFILIVLIIIKSKSPAKDMLIFLKLLFDIITKTGNIDTKKIDEVEAQELEVVSSIIPKNKTLKNQNNEIEKEMETVKIMKKVTSNINVITDAVANNPNITIRNENQIKKSKSFYELTEKCNCKSQCRNNQCSCKKSGKLCKQECHNGTKCLNCESI